MVEQAESARSTSWLYAARRNDRLRVVFGGSQTEMHNSHGRGACGSVTYGSCRRERSTQSGSIQRTQTTVQTCSLKDTSKDVSKSVFSAPYVQLKVKDIGRIIRLVVGHQRSTRRREAAAWRAEFRLARLESGWARVVRATCGAPMLRCAGAAARAGDDPIPDAAASGRTCRSRAMRRRVGGWR